MQPLIEVWRDIPSFEGLYQVSNQGRARSLPRFETIVSERYPGGFTRKRKGTLIKQSIVNSGYLSVGLHSGGIVKRCLVHRLVAEAFLVKNSEDHNEVNHVDEDKLNNTVTNLEWCSRAGNALHSSHKFSGERSGTSKLKEHEVKEIKRRLATGETLKSISEKFGVTHHAIFRIKRGDNWAWLSLD